MKYANRVSKLERRLAPAAAAVVVMPIYEGETDKQATAAYEANNGPIYDPFGTVIRVMIMRFGGERPTPVMSS